MIAVLAIGWAWVAARLVLSVEPRLITRRRTRALRPQPSLRWIGAWSTSPIVRVVDDIRARRVRRRIDERIRRQVPLALDLLVVALKSGDTPRNAVAACSQHLPAELGGRFSDVVRAHALGEPLASALSRLSRPGSTDLERVRSALEDAALGSPAVAALERLADDERAALRRRSEARARTVPVRLLFPLVFLVLPAFGLITVVPALEAGLRNV